MNVTKGPHANRCVNAELKSTPRRQAASVPTEFHLVKDFAPTAVTVELIKGGYTHQ
jgi:hypothetical protein